MCLLYTEDYHEKRDELRAQEWVVGYKVVVPYRESYLSPCIGNVGGLGHRVEYLLGENISFRSPGFHIFLDLVSAQSMALPSELIIRVRVEDLQVREVGYATNGLAFTTNRMFIDSFDKAGEN